MSNSQAKAYRDAAIGAIAMLLEAATEDSTSPKDILRAAEHYAEMLVKADKGAGRPRGSSSRSLLSDVRANLERDLEL